MESTNQQPAIGEITRVEHNGQLVLTTAQLAEFYGTTVDNIGRNFRNNSDRFVEGKHFFKLEGDELASFRKNFPEALSKFSPTLYLWTKRGAFHHAKMLNTDRAWEVYELLEENYFDSPTAKQVAQLGELLALGRKYLVFLREQEIDRLAIDRERLEHDKKQLLLDHDKYSLERDRLELDKKIFAVENSDEKKFFERAKLYRELASAAKDDILREELIHIAMNILLMKSFRQ